MYVGETSRSLGTRFKEHSRLKPPLTAIGEHCKFKTTTTTSKLMMCKSSPGRNMSGKEK